MQEEREKVTISCNKLSSRATQMCDKSKSTESTQSEDGKTEDKRN